MASYQLTWCAHFGGYLALGHRPGKRLRAALEASGCSLVLSLLSERESSAEATSGRVRLPLESARPPSEARDAEVRHVFGQIDEELTRGGRVFIHCSAGLHRTGMVALAYFRHRGLSVEMARSAIAELRAQTEEELTAERCAWGERFANEP